MRKKQIATYLLFLIALVRGMAQDAQFSQSYANPLYLSPSFAGMTDGSRMIMNYRNQWPSLPGAFVTYSFSYDMFFPQARSGFGLLVTKDEAGGGLLSVTNMGLQYSYNLMISRKFFLRPGLHFAFAQSAIDREKVILGNQIQNFGEVISGSTLPLEFSEKKNAIDASTSIMGFGENYWQGITVDHLMRNDVSFTGVNNRLPVKYTLYGGIMLDITKRRRGRSAETMSLSYIYKRQAQFQQLDFGAYWTSYPLEFGLWYRGIPIIKNEGTNQRNNDALIFIFGYHYKYFRFAYSYDFTTSGLASSSGGAHEISIIMNLSQEDFSRKKGAIPCNRAGDPFITKKYRRNFLKIF